MTSISRQTLLKVVYWHVVAAVVCAGLIGATITRRLHSFDRLIVEAAKEYDVDPRLVSAVIWRESRFKPAAVGEKGEIGLMQVTELAGQEWAEADGFKLFAKRDLFKPEINLKAGTWYLSRALENWSDHHPDATPYALAEYNAGRSNARRWAEAESKPGAKGFLEAVTYDSTRKYITDILERYRGGV